MDGAITQFRSAINSSPNYAQAHFQLAIALEEKATRTSRRKNSARRTELDPQLSLRFANHRITFVFVAQATISDSTGTPRATFIATLLRTASARSSLRHATRVSNWYSESSWQTYSTAACVPMVEVPAKIKTEFDGSSPHERDDGIVFLSGAVEGFQ